MHTNFLNLHSHPPLFFPFFYHALLIVPVLFTGEVQQIIGGMH